MTTKVTKNLILNVGSLTRIASFDVNNPATVDLLNVFDASSDSYLLIVDHLQVDTTNAGAVMYFGNAPSSWTTTGWERNYEHYDNINGYTSGYTGSWGYATLASNIISTSTGISVFSWIFNPNNASKNKRVYTENSGSQGSGAVAGVNCETILRTDNITFDSIQIQATGGNISHISGSLYRMEK